MTSPRFSSSSYLRACIALAFTLTHGSLAHAQQRPAARPPARPAPSAAPAASSAPAPSAAPSAAAPNAPPDPSPSGAPTPPPAPPSTATPASTLPPDLRLVVTAEINGRIATLDCGDSPAPSVLARVAQSLANTHDALALDAGDLYGSGALPRFAITEGSPDEFATAVAATGLRALAVAHRDIAADRVPFINAARALAAHNVPYVLSNLQCAPSAQALCDVVRDQADEPLILDTPAGRIAYLAVISPANRGRMAAELMAGLTFTDPETAVRDGSARARAAGASHVIVAYDPSGANELTDALELAGKFRFTPGQGPDLFLVHDVDDHITTARGAHDSVPVIAAVPGEALLVNQRELRTTPVPQIDGAPPEVVNTFSRNLTRSVCTNYNRPLPGGRLGAPLDREGFSQLVGDILRDITRSEVSILNRGYVSRTANYPFSGSISGLDLFMAMPFDSGVRVARIQGSVLKAFVTGPRAARFSIRGVTTDGGVKINGRLIDDLQYYNVVTNQFVADGGDGGVGPNIPWRQHGEDTLNDEVFTFLSQARTVANVREAPLDPAQRTRWIFRAAAEFALSGVHLDNPNSAALTDTQLVRTPSLAIRGEVQFRADADHPGYTWENQLLARYGMAATAMMAGMPLPALAENADLIGLRSNVTFRRFGRMAPAWYVPLPYGEAYLESEFNRAPSMRQFHHLELRPSIGVRFNLHERFSIYGGGGLTSELLATPATNTPMGAPTTLGSITAGYIFRPGTLFQIGTRAMTGESSLDAVFRAPGSGLDGSGTQVRFRVKVAFPLLDTLSLTATYDLYARSILAGDPTTMVQTEYWGISGDIQVGLKFDIARLYQSFTF